MIYKNKDGSIYEIKRLTSLYDRDDAEDSINEIIEVLNYLLKKTKIIRDEHKEKK